MHTNLKIIGRRIKEIRSSKNLTQAELAEQANVSAPYISHIETETKQVSLITLIRIANALEVTVDTLLTGHQGSNADEYLADLDFLLKDCSSEEKRIIIDMISAIKKTLRNHH